MATLEELRNVRLEKLEKLMKLGINPYPPRSEKSHSNAEVVDNFDSFEGQVVTLAGRMMSWREHGPLAFADIMDQTGKIQLYIKQDELADTDKDAQTLGFGDLNLLDIGDFVEATGEVTKTKRGEISLMPAKIKILSKSLRPLPEKREGLKDVEERYRRRYLDLISSEETRKVLDARWKISQETRKFMWSKDFYEVETPILQPIYGGTNARPFETHFNALDCDFYLRVAPELYLKRLVIGGYERVFEIARNFRNEGIDHAHFPEFTMLEWYEAYVDYHRVMDLAEELTKHLVKELTGGTKITVGEEEIDVGGNWPRIPIDEIVKDKLDVDWESVTDDEVKALQKKHGVEIKGIWTKDKALFAIYDHVVTKNLKEPIWVIDYPMEVSPLSKTHRSKPRMAERFEGYIGGVEIFDGWSEIVSGLEQRRRFENEQSNMKEGDTEAMPLDEDFIEALEYGCPPMGGIGFGIDRLVMFLTNTWAIKDVVAFPTLRPRGSNETNSEKESQQ